MSAPENDWIEWSGGECPVRGQYIDAKLRDGFLFENELADTLCGDFYDAKSCTSDNDNWMHNGSSDDIIAYRVVSA